MEIPKNIDMNKLMSMLSQMDKKQLEEGLNKVNQMLNSQNKGQSFNGKEK